MRIFTCALCTLMLSSWPLSTYDATASAERILVIIPTPWYSHQLIHRLLCVALNKRGHELVVLTPMPLRDPTLKNYTEIVLSTMHDLITEHLFYEKALQLPLYESTKHSLHTLNKAMAIIFNEPEFRKLYRRNSTEKFDAVIVESVCGPSMYAFAHRFNAPLIGISSVDIHNYHRYVFGSPIIPSHPSNWELNTRVGQNPSFWQRLRNWIEVWSYIHYWLNNFVTHEQRLVREYLGDDVPYVIDIMKNMSIMLVNYHPALSYVRPEQTNAIFFNGLHIQKTPPSLPEGQKRFLDDATEGFIYVSFGTNANWHLLPNEMLENFVGVFSKLPYKIVWKCEFDELPRKLDNALIAKWFPQQGILAHPNIKLFIYQGGLQSTEEAVHYAVPLLGIPLMYDQGSRVQRMASLGVATLLELNELTEEHIDTAIRRILGDKSYKERMVNLSYLVKDQPYDSVENAMLHIEYTMRHRPSYLLFSESDQPWYRRYDMDIIAMLSTLLFIMACIVALILFQILRFTFKRCLAHFKVSQLFNVRRKLHVNFVSCYK